MADAVLLHDDMELVGVADVVYDYRVKVAVERGYSISASVVIPVAGSLDDLLKQ